MGILSTFIKHLLAYGYGILGKSTGRCAWGTRTAGAKITPFWNVRIGARSFIDPGAILDASGKGTIRLGTYGYVHSHAMILCYGGTIEMGDYVSINPFSVVYGHGGVRIGNYVRIAAGTVIAPVNHTYGDTASTIYSQGITSKGIVIEDNVWIGAHTTILDGVTIGKNSVVGAGSVVTSDIPADSVAFGVPCKVQRKRE